MNKAPKIEFTRRWIEWVLDFVQTDLNSLPKSKFRGLCAEMFYFTTNAFEDGERGFEQLLLQYCFDKLTEIKVYNFDEASLNEMRKQDHPEWTIEELETLLSELGEKVPNIQRALKDFLDDTQDLLKKPRMGFSPITDKEHHVSEIHLPETENRLDIRKMRGWFYWDKVTVPKDYSHNNWAIMNLANLMNGLSADAVRTCKGCGRYFANLSNREKLYCNSSCASRSIARMKREELKRNNKKYQAYLKKQREIMRKRYEEKRKAELGPNVKVRGRKKH